MKSYHTILLSVFLSLGVAFCASRPACALAPASEKDQTLKVVQALTGTLQMDARGAYLFGVFELGTSRIADLLAQTESILLTGEIAHSDNRILAAQRLLLRAPSQVGDTALLSSSGDRSEDLQFLTSTVADLKLQVGPDYFAKFLRLLESSEIKSLRRMAGILQIHARFRRITAHCVHWRRCYGRDVLRK